MSTLNGDVPELHMSSFPQTTAEGVNHCRPCKEYNHYKTGMYQWDIMLSMSYQDLIKDDSEKPVSTMYPVIFASNDAQTWNVVADADDVAHGTDPNNKDSAEPTHISAPLLIANLKNFGCVDEETAETDPFINHFPSKGRAQAYKWKLDEHLSLHGSVNLVACVMQGMDDINQLIHTYVRHCTATGTEMKCHLSPREALQKCFAIGSACGQACGYFSPASPHCKGGTLDPALFEGLTQRRVKIKTRGGGGAAQALVYCSKKGCKTGYHFKDMYVEAENPLEFLQAQMDVRNKEKGSFNVVLFAISDFHPPTHTFEVSITEDGEGEIESHHTHHIRHHTNGHLLHKHHEKEKEKEHKKDEKEEHKHKKEDKKDEKEDEKEDEKKDEKKHEKKEKKKEKHERSCVDLPGVRLGEIDGSSLKHFVKDKKVSTPFACTSECARRLTCKQSIFAHANTGCYLFKIATVEVNAFENGFNSSYCGDKKDEELMMTMLHQAYKGYVPAKPKTAPAAAPPPPGPPPPGIRVLSEARRLVSDSKFYWSIAHVPNLTIGMLKDQGASSMRVIPRNGSCFTTPGFIYMVACMTAKPVYMNGRSLKLDPPPFNDRCLAVGGLCGATCGSRQEADENVARYCPLANGGAARLLREGPQRLLRASGAKEVSPYASVRIPKDMLVQPIQPRSSATTHSIAARVFFHLFIFFIAVSYVATVLGKFPGNFTDFYPEHAWGEVYRHGYAIDQFGSAVSCGVSASEVKMVVFRNWLGKIAARPHFDDPEAPTFRRWVDVFCDEGHREGARILWMAWADFLDTNPPVEFLEQWSRNMQNMTWEESQTRSPFEFSWPARSGGQPRKVLPVVPKQAERLLTEPGVEVPEGGVPLQQDSLAKLKDLLEVFAFVPDNLKLEPSLPKNDDVVLTRAVQLGGPAPPGKRGADCFTQAFGPAWRKELEQKIESRAPKGGDKASYKKSLTVTDASGKAVDLFQAGGSASGGAKPAEPVEKQFPLHLREPLPRPDRQVILVYCARAKPESDRKGIDKTRELDKYLWACLRPKAVRRGSGSGPRRTFKGGGERAPLLQGQEESLPPKTWSLTGGGPESFVLEEVRKCVNGVVERQHEKFLNKKESASSRRSNSSSLPKEYAKAYMRYRTVDSDWEMARFCYGEIVGEERDADGDEVLILDNPSPALLELVSNLQRPGMGLVALEAEDEKRCFGMTQGQKRTARVAKPSLTFLFANVSGSPSPAAPPEFAQEFRKKLQECTGASNQDLAALVIQSQSKGHDLVVDVTGPGKLIEPIRDCSLSNVRVLSYLGRMIDSHPTVIVKKDLMMPYAGVRGKSGGLNYVVDVLQFRDGFIGTGEKEDPTPDRMLYGIFDARHQPHPDYWKHVLPKFLHRAPDSLYKYEVNDSIALVQAPQHFAAVDQDDDVLDVHNGMCFNLMNVIRNRCGGVTSCGTNAVWQVNASEFSRQGENSESLEYFDSRTKIEDTASSHIQFCMGKRSVYVQENISTGIAKLNADYLCALQRWAEGAVQLFWLQIFVDRTTRLLVFTFSVIGFYAVLYFSLYGGWTKDAVGYNIFCDVEGSSTLLLGESPPFCSSMYNIFSQFLEHTIDKVIFEMAAHDYMRLIDFSITWFFVCAFGALLTALLSFKGIMPRVVRVFIMMENISYWLTSCSIFFWLSLTLFMIIGMNPPLMFNVTHFMLFILAINITQHCMINEYKNMGGCSELSIWRSQQAYTLAAPLYVMAIARGTGAAWGIIWRRLDKSFWTSSDHGSDVIRGVTVWVTFIWASFVCCTVLLGALHAKSWLFNEIGDKIQKQCQVVAVLMLGLLAITVWEPFLALWGADKSINSLGKHAKEGEQGCLGIVATLLVWWRSKAWVMRYVIDFGMPILVLSGVLGGGVSLLMLAAHATVIHSFRV